MNTAQTNVLILGATGGIGSQVLTRLLDRGCNVTVIVRNAARLPQSVQGHSSLTVIEEPGGHLALSDKEFRTHTQCDAVVQCIGHNMTCSGICGHPRRLCRDTLSRVCEAIRASSAAVQPKLIVVSTEGVSRPDGGDRLQRGCCESCILSCLLCCLPPHADNADTLACLHKEHVLNPSLSFCAVRPSDLVDEPTHTAFKCHTELQNGIFASKTTSRANVGEFMADLVTKADVWAQWKNTYPHIQDESPTKDEKVNAAPKTD